MKRLYLVRHTRPESAEGVCYGRLDVELASTWPEEFERCLAQLPTAACIVSSPSSRCLRLAQALARRDSVEVQLDERLLEMDFGTWEGRAWDDIRREAIDEWAADPVDYAPGNGESLRMLWVRVLAFRRTMMERLPVDAVIVSHHGPLRALVAQAAGQPMQSVLAHRIAWGEVVALDEASMR